MYKKHRAFVLNQKLESFYTPASTSILLVPLKIGSYQATHKIANH